MIQIRQAEAKDVSAISNLYRQFVRPVAPDTTIDVREDRIEQIRAHPENFLFVLEINSRIYGTAFLTLCLDPVYRHQPYAILENFVIDESQRGKRYGSMLARYVENFCHQREERCQLFECYGIWRRPGAKRRTGNRRQGTVFTDSIS
jgi:N-acetylglutamate synthase-like GNAT family acetyltransferase